MACLRLASSGERGSSSCSCRSSSYPKDSSTSPCLEIKIPKNKPWTLEGPFSPKVTAQMWFLSNLTLSTASQCVHWYWKQLTGPWEPVVTSWSKATWLLLSLIRRDSQRAWHLHCLIKCLTSLAIFLCRKWVVSPTGDRAWHWDETRWFIIMVLIPNGPHLTDTVQCNFFFFFFMWKKNNNKVCKFEGFALYSSGGSNGFYKYLCIDILPQPANI